MEKVAIIMGSKSDFDVMNEAIEILKSFKITVEYDIVSAHRTPKKMIDYAQNAEKKGIKVIIAGAGGSAHLPGMVASITSIPVIYDPSHATGKRSFVEGISLAAIVNGADGLIIESHPNPQKSISDPDQAISFEEFRKIVSLAHKTRNLINS